MPPKNRDIKDHNTRNRSRSRTKVRESVPADANAPLTSESASDELSPPREGKHPPPEAEIPTSDATASVSTQQQDVSSVISTKVTDSHISKNDTENGSKNPYVQEEGISTEGLANFAKMSDIREVSKQTNLQPDDPPVLLKTSALTALTSELTAIRSRMDKLDKIEVSLSTLVNQFGGLAERTVQVETKVESHESKLTKVNAELAALRETVDSQGRALAKLTNMESDLLKQNKEVKADLLKQNRGITKEMNQLIDQQKNQVESFLSTTKRIENNIYEKVEQKIEVKVDEKVEKKVHQVSQEATQKASFQSLKDQAFAKRRNLVITGLEEDDTKSTTATVKELFKSLGADKLGIKQAYRIGLRQPDNTSYRRPILVEFHQLSDRNKVWKKRMQTPSAEEGEQRVKIQADLPKLLRDEMHILYRITRAAANFPEFKTAVVRSYAIQLNGKEFNPTNLEQLPLPIRPSTISNPKSDEAIAFFSKYSPMSNHHPSPFKVQDQSFENMEHYLAVQRAKLSGQESIMERASTATDPKEAKAVLRSLREDHAKEWSEKVEQVTTDGLRAKFSQNSHLLKFLKNTQGLLIGEASKDPRWGVGFDLNSPEVLDPSKWNNAGNLLGKCLMKVRDELPQNGI